jgi:hypothetical protein
MNVVVAGRVASSPDDEFVVAAVVWLPLDV